MRILVFGKSGQVATELRKSSRDHVSIIALGRTDLDLTAPEGCAEAIDTLHPDAVINAAAYTAVDRAQIEQDLAFTLNANAPKVIAQTCADRAIPLVHLSTDYVFDGTGTRPWTETDPIAPLNIYGRSKAAGERAIRACGGPHAILRTSWVFSAQGGNFVKTMLRLGQSHDTLRIVSDQVGGPTGAADIAATSILLARALAEGETGGTYHYAGAPFANWASFARAIFARSGQATAVEEMPTTDYPTPATRPLNSRLDCNKLMVEFGIAAPHWPTALDKVLEELQT